MKIKNLTPHNVVLVDDSGNVIATFNPEGTARCTVSYQEKDAVMINGINVPIVEETYGDIVGLPAPANDTIYIVSGLVKAAGKLLGRTDLVAPTMQVRNEAGQIVGCKALG